MDPGMSIIYICMCAGDAAWLENNNDIHNHMPYATACEENKKSHMGERIRQGVI